MAKISFNYNGVAYCIRTGGVLERQVGGLNMPFVKIQIFYPVEDIDELNALTTDYKIALLNERLELLRKN